MRSYHLIVPALLSLLLVQCGGHGKIDKISDGRSLSFEDTLWSSCQESNEMTSFRIEYESAINQVDENNEDEANVFKQYCHTINDAIWCETGSPADNILSSLSDDIRHKMSTCCYQSNGSFFKTAPTNKYYNFVEIASPQEAPAAADQDSDTHPYDESKNDAQPNQEKAEKPQESRGFWSRLFGSGEEEEEDTSAELKDNQPDKADTIFNGWFEENEKDNSPRKAGIVHDTRNGEDDKLVTLYHRSFDPKNFGACQQK